MRWECVRCGSCCRNIGVKEWFDDKLIDELDLLKDNTCRFLEITDDGSRCSIHENRPGACRRYPFVIANECASYYLAVHKRCQGLGQGPEIPIERTFITTLRSIEELLGLSFIVKSHPGRENDFGLYRIA
jgi:Fe-S-cluster containining protein